MEKSREYLRQRFKAGFKPTEKDFHDWIAAFYHKEEDAIGLEGITIDAASITTDRTLKVKPEMVILNQDGLETGLLSIDNSGHLLLRNLEPKHIKLQHKEGAGFSDALSVFSNGNVSVAKTLTVADKINLNRTGENSAELIFSRAPGGFSTNQTGVLSQLAKIQGKRIGTDSTNQKAELTFTCFYLPDIVNAPPGGGGGSQTNTDQEVLKLESLPGKNNGRVTILGDLHVMGSTTRESGGGQWSGPGSDFRLKKDVRDFREGLEIVRALRPVQFQYNGKGNTPDDGVIHTGFIAQEVQRVFPEMVTSFRARLEKDDAEESELLNLDTSALQYILLNAIAELDKRLQILEKNIKAKNLIQNEPVNL